MDNTTSNTCPDRGARLSSPEIPFFAAELKNVAHESTKTITLLDHDLNEIKCVLHYLYHGNAERALKRVGMLTNQDQKLMERVDYEDLADNLTKLGDAALGFMADIWLCGASLRFGELRNAVLSVMYERAKCVTLGGFGGEALKRIFAKTQEFSKLRWFAIDAEIDSLLCKWSHDLLGKYTTSEEVYQELIQEFLVRASNAMGGDEFERALQAAKDVKSVQGYFVPTD